jgi:hypothetical protein
MIMTEAQAGIALNEVGVIQQSLENATYAPPASGPQIVERLDAVMDLYKESSTVYAALVEPMLQWAIYSVAPKFIAPNAPNAESWKILFDSLTDFHERWKHLDPN